MKRIRRLGVMVTVAAAISPVLVATQGAAPAQGAQNPINHVVVLMQENRSFDHYFGQIHHEGQLAAEAEPTTASNPNPLNPLAPPIKNFHKTDYCEVADLDHSWNGTHKEYDGGHMDGFTAANVNAADPTGSRTMGWYDQADLPFYYALYNTFSMADRYFASALTQTFPNRFYLLAGTSFGHIRNDFPLNPNDFDVPTIFKRLDDTHVSWKIYFSEVPFAFLFKYVRDNAAGHVFPISQYYADAATGMLPQVSFVDPIFLGPANVENDEHPPSNVQVGERFTSDVVNALFTSPNWGSSAMFLTYDEHGGFYDHVHPPPAVPPDNIAPMLQTGDVPGAFDRYGIRVPAAVISPYAKPHFVSHTVYDHTSILRFIETRFGLHNLTKRDLNANPMLDMFNFHHASFATPPSLPPAPLDPAQVVKCLSAPPNGGV